MGPWVFRSSLTRIRELLISPIIGKEFPGWEEYILTGLGIYIEKCEVCMKHCLISEASSFSDIQDMKNQAIVGVQEAHNSQKQNYQCFDVPEHPFSVLQ